MYETLQEWYEQVYQPTAKTCNEIKGFVDTKAWNDMGDKEKEAIGMLYAHVVMERVKCVLIEEYVLGSNKE